MPRWKISPAGPDDADALAALIHDYPFKTYQQAAQGLDKDKLTAFLTRGALTSLKRPGAIGWLVQRDDEPMAAAIMTPNQWHGGFYGMKMARCAMFLSYKDTTGATPLLCEAIIKESEAQGFEHVSVRIDGSEFENLHRLEEAGFRLIDCSVKLGARIRPDSPPNAEGCKVRPYRDDDREAVVRISGSSHPKNHFYNDHALGREETQTLFRAWVERCLDGLAAHLFVAENGGEILGFVTYLTNRALNQELGLRLAVLDYIALDGQAQGHGVGAALLEQSLSALAADYDQVELRSSQNNYPALAIYSRYGFRVISNDFLLHLSLSG